MSNYHRKRKYSVWARFSPATILLSDEVNVIKPPDKVTSNLKTTIFDRIKGSKDKFFKSIPTIGSLIWEKALKLRFLIITLLVLSLIYINYDFIYLYATELKDYVPNEYQINSFKSNLNLKLGMDRIGEIMVRITGVDR